MNFRQYRRCGNCLVTDYGGGGIPLSCKSCGFPFQSHSHTSSSSSKPPSIACASSSSLPSSCRYPKKKPRGEHEAGALVLVEKEAALVHNLVEPELAVVIISCAICKSVFPRTADVYALESCRHGFCRRCLADHVARHARQLVLLQCGTSRQLAAADAEDCLEGTVPCPTCGLAISRQDIRVAAGAKTLGLFDALAIKHAAWRFNGCLENSCPSCASATEKSTLVKPVNLPELTSMRIRGALMARSLPFSGSKTNCLQRLQTVVSGYSDSLVFCLSCDFVRCENCGDFIKDHLKSASSSSPSTHQCPPTPKLLLSLFHCMVKLEKVASKTRKVKKVVATPSTNISNKANISTASKPKLKARVMVDLFATSKPEPKATVDWFAKGKANMVNAEIKLPKPGKIMKSNSLLSNQLKKTINLPPNPSPTLHRPFKHSVVPPAGYSQPPHILPSPIPAYNHAAVMPMHPNPQSWSPMNDSPAQTYDEDMADSQSMDEEPIDGNGEEYIHYQPEGNLAGNSTAGSKDNNTVDYATAPPKHWPIHPPVPQMHQQWPKKSGKYKNEPMSSKARKLAVNLENAADLEIKKIFEQLVEIVSLSPPNPDKLPPPAVSLICGHKAVMRVIGELVRNDSILDVSNRSMVYFALFSLLQAFASRQELLPFLCQPCFSNNSSDDVWTQKKRWRLAGSLVGDLRKLYRQMKVLLGKSSYLMACNDDVGSMEAALVAVGTNTYKELKLAIQAWERTSRHIWCEDADDYFRQFGFGDSVLPDTLSRGFSDVRDVELPSKAVGISQMSNDQATNGGDLAKDGEFIYAPSSEEVEAYKNALHPLQHGFESLSESHYYRNEQNKGNWRVSSIRHVSKEIAVLSTNLPLDWESSIFVRFDNSRMDLLKVLIIGPQNTPYMNGVFLFDMWLSENYPNSPPSMQFLTTGGGIARFNPNLYTDGTVCLSLLGTWDGPSWVAGQSTILQVLISIQSLVFVTDPYSNEPGQEKYTVKNCPEAREYIETQKCNTLMYSMLPALTNPDPVFRDVILTHFRLKREEIIHQCAKWVEGSSHNVYAAEAVQNELQKL